jgi:hypothetical protein
MYNVLNPFWMLCIMRTRKQQRPSVEGGKQTGLQKQQRTLRNRNRTVSSRPPAAAPAPPAAPPVVDIPAPPVAAPVVDIPAPPVAAPAVVDTPAPPAAPAVVDAPPVVDIPAHPAPEVGENVPAPVPSSGPILTPVKSITDEIRRNNAQEVLKQVADKPLPKREDVVEGGVSGKDRFVIVNPASKFVVVTYWWGRGNKNANVKHPCDAYEKELKKEILSWMSKEEGWDTKTEQQQKETVIDEYNAELEARITEIAKNKPEDVSDEEWRERAIKLIKGERPAMKFEDMIQRFQDDCISAKCNFLTMEYEFGRPLYQAAINAKPAFIQKVLNETGLAVVYIDGDMKVRQYPKIFDMEGIDFMARGWNIDPRATSKYIDNDICVDPYVFETSGGIQYFANTEPAKDLLNTWILSNTANPGKADDRVISAAFNIFKYQCCLKFIQLPIEFLWLTDNYTYQDPENTRQEWSIIEHPECLTSEDVASEAGASSNREPLNYSKIIGSSEDCEDRQGLVFYEYIYFESPEPSFKMYLDYLEGAKKKDGELAVTVYRTDKKYGDHNNTANKNIEESKAESTKDSIPDILRRLSSGNDVTIGEDPRIEEKKALNVLEFVAYNIKAEIGSGFVDPDFRPIFDTKRGMFFSAKSRTLWHVLAMCENLEDLTKIFNESYTFLERISCYWLK